MKKYICPPGKILNPETKRCVHINKKIGKKVVERYLIPALIIQKYQREKIKMQKVKGGDGSNNNNQKLYMTTKSKSNNCSVKVVNVKVANIRPEGYSNLKEWYSNKDNVYIGRSGVVFVKTEHGKERFPKIKSKWANPYKISTKGYTRESSLQSYETYIRSKIKEDPKTYNLSELKGKTLGCWCKPEKCHGDILKKLCLEQTLS